MFMTRFLKAVALIGVTTHAVFAQDTGPEVSPAVRQRIEADFLSDVERQDLRIYHGLWTQADLDTPTRRAAAALIVGAIDDPSLHDERTPALDRAEAALERGDLSMCLDLVAGNTSIWAIRLRAQALSDLGRFDQADAALDPLIELMTTAQLDASQLVEGVRGLRLRTWLRGASRGDGSDDRQILSLLNKARDELDRLAWPVRLAEAELLYSRHNRAEAFAAAQEVLSLNPRCSGALAILGNLAVDSFDFDRANDIADILDAIATPFDAPSAEADVIRARSLLREREAHEAEQPLERLLGAYPSHRLGLALSAAAAAGSYDDEQAIALLTLSDDLSPGHPLAWYEVARVRSETRQYEQASEAFTQAINRQPNSPAPYIGLGLMEMQAGRDTEALAALEHAMTLDPFNAQAANSLKLMRELISYDTIETEHFIIRYKPGIDEALALDMPPILERIHDRVCGDEEGGIDFEPDRRTTIELMPNHEWFAVRITGMPSIHTMAASTGPVIAMESPQFGPGFTVGPYDWARVLQHEYTHTVSLGRTLNRIPHWMTEAAAVYLEDAPRDAERWKLLAQISQNDGWFDLEEINIAFVRPKKPTDRAQAYAQAHWMYQFIMDRWGGDAPLALMDQAAAGINERDAFVEVLGLDRDAFLTEFIAYAKTQLDEVGMALPGGMSPIADLIEPWTQQWADRGSSPTAEERLEVMRELYETHPNHPDVLEGVILAEVEAAGGEPTEALVPILQQYAQIRTVDDLPHRLLARWFLTRQGPAEHEQAIEHLLWLDERQTTSAAYAAELARQFVAFRDYESAQRFAERASSIAPFDANEREFAATVALLRQDYETAERHIRALTIIEPDRPQHTKRLEAVQALRVKNSGG